MDLNLRTARLTNPDARFVGVNLNTRNLDDDAAQAVLAETAARLGLPCVDPLRGGVGPIVDAIVDTLQ